MIGKRYKEEKKAIGANRASIKEQVKQINKHVIPHNEEVKDYKSTSAKIAEQSKVSHATVERAEKFADAFLTVLGLTLDCSAIFSSVFFGVVTVTTPLSSSSD